MTTLLAYPNVSEGRDAATIAAITRAFGPGLLDAHSDPDHHRTAFTLAGAPGQLTEALLAGAGTALQRIRLSEHDGVHPRVGALDVAPVIWLDAAARGAACAEALVLADRLGADLGLPVLLYGVLAGGRTRAQLRRGGPTELARRIADGQLAVDFGPPRPDPRVGVTLVAARPPLVAFNVVLAAPATLELARTIAARIREGGPDGLPDVRAIGVWLDSRDRAQVSTNIENPGRCAPADVLAAIARHAPVDEAELVGLAPERTLASWPSAVPLRGRATIEQRLGVRAASD